MARDPLGLNFGREKRFCVYIYFDPRPRKKREPIYVGKGLTKHRPDFHWKRGSHNTFLSGVLHKIRIAGLEPIIEFVGFFDDENEAFACEMALIKRFGRRNLGIGTLCNLTDGGEGTSGSNGPRGPHGLNKHDKRLETAAGLSAVFAREIRLARRRLRLTQHDLASKLRISQSYLSRVERGIENPSLALCEEYAAGVGCTPSITLTPLTQQA